MAGFSTKTKQLLLRVQRWRLRRGQEPPTVGRSQKLTLANHRPPILVNADAHFLYPSGRLIHRFVPEHSAIFLEMFQVEIFP